MPEKQKNEEKEIGIFSNPMKIFALEAGLFLLTLLLGLLAGWKLKELYQEWIIVPEPLSIWKFLFSFVIATLFVLWFVYFVRLNKGKKIFFKILFLLAGILGNLFFFSLWFLDIVCFVLVFILTILWFKKPSLFFHNLFLIFAIAGIGSRLGLSLEAKAVILLLIIFSVYDYLAVYKTKHMVKMAEEMVSQKAILGIVVPQRISDFKTDLKNVRPGGRFLVLGAGDIVFPLIFAVSLLNQGFFQAFSVILFSFVGLSASFLFFVSQKKRKPMPALPPIAFFSIIGYLLSILVR